MTTVTGDKPIEHNTNYSQKILNGILTTITLIALTTLACGITLLSLGCPIPIFSIILTTDIAIYLTVGGGSCLTVELIGFIIQQVKLYREDQRLKAYYTEINNLISDTREYFNQVYTTKFFIEELVKGVESLTSLKHLTKNCPENDLLFQYLLKDMISLFETEKLRLINTYQNWVTKH